MEIQFQHFHMKFSPHVQQVNSIIFQVHCFVFVVFDPNLSKIRYFELVQVKILLFGTKFHETKKIGDTNFLDS